MLKLLGAISAVVFSAIVAGAITGYPGFAETVSAQETAAAPLSATLLAANPVITPDCTTRGWPYQCGSGKTVRIVPIDRLN